MKNWIKYTAILMFLLVFPAICFAKSTRKTNETVYYVDPSNADQGVVGNGSTIKALATTIGTSTKATLVLPHSGTGVTTAYTVSTALDLSGNSNFNLQFENGAQIDGASGVTIYSPSNIIVQPGQHIKSGAGLLVFYSKEGKVYPQWWGAKGDWNGTTGTDDSIAFHSAVTACPRVDGNGASFLVTSEISAKYWSSTKGTTLRNLKLYGQHTGRSVLSLAGVSFCDLDYSVYLESDSSTFPKTILLLGRTSAGSAGWHKLGPNITGSASEAGIYSIASETNKLDGLFLSVYSKYGFYTSQGDDLSLGGLTGSSNLTLYLSKSHLQISSADANSAVIYISAGVGTGFHFYKDLFLAAGDGNYIVIKTGADAADTVSPLIFDNIGGDATSGCTPTTGVLLTTDASGYDLKNAQFRAVELSGVTYAYNSTIDAPGSINTFALMNCLIETSTTLPSVFPVLYSSILKMPGTGNIVSTEAYNNFVMKGTGEFQTGVTNAGNFIIDTTGFTSLELTSYLPADPKVMLFGNQKIAWHTAAPTHTVYAPSHVNSWRQGDIVYNSGATTGQASGWMCTSSGTFSPASTTGGITAGTALLTVASASGFLQGHYITIVGVTGTFRINAINGLVFTLEGNADATVAGAAVATPDPTFAALANLP